jgi:spore germination protein YaaH
MKHHVSPTPTRARRAAVAGVVIAALTAGLCSLVRASGQSTPSTPVSRDPSVGAHALQERQFGGAAGALMTPRMTAASATTAVPATAGATPAVTVPGREVLGFAPYWDMANWKLWQLSRLTTIAYFGVTLDGNGNPIHDEGWTAWQGAQLTDLVSAAHAAGVRVLVTVKCFDEAGIASIVSTPAHAQTAIATAIALARQRGLDGVDVDFEGSSSPSYPTIQQDLTAFAGSLTAQTHAAVAGSEVVIDTYSGSASWDGGLFNIGALAPNVDALFVMAYDMNFDNTPNHASADAPLNGWTYNDTGLVAQYLSKAPASKVILGVPYYGYKWDVSTPVANAHDIGSAQADTYSGTFDDFACAPQLTRQWDSTAATPWATWYSPATGDPCGGNHNSWREMYYENAASIGPKYDLVNQAGLRGAGIWALGYDDGHTELWDLIAGHLTVAHAPVAHASAPASPQHSTAFTVTWAVDPASVPATSYLIWASQDGGTWTAWTSTSATSATFHGFAGHGYSFYAEAFGAGGWGSGAPAGPADAQATTTISAGASNPEPFTGLYAVDGYGVLHPGASPPLPTSATWPGWNIARGLAMTPSGQTGYVLDGFGGVHPFGGAPGMAASVYWPGWDIARGIAVSRDGQGVYVLDGFGGVHPYGSTPGVAAGTYWRGWDIARGIALDACDPAGHSGWVLDGWGGVHPFGGAPGVTTSVYWPGWDIARAIASTCTNGQPGGYVLDGWGGIHPFGAALGVAPGTYWKGWDIARGLVALPGGGGYVVDGWGGFHPFGGAPGVDSPTYTPRQDIVKGASAS